MANETDAATTALTRGLQDALGDDLVALMLYGSTARGTQVPGRSDRNVLLVVRDASAATLRRASPALSAWAKAGHPPPLIQTEADWAASADVFPMEIEDIREAHVVLAGRRDVISALVTTVADQRRELEREARAKLIRLRAEYAVAAHDGKVLAELLVRALGTFLVLFRAALRLTGAASPADPVALVHAAAAAAGFDAAPFEWAIAARQAAKTPALKAFDPLAVGYLAGVERLVGYVDGLKAES